ncbi:MAG TPA: hypothetical protein VF933_32035 [Streptosporangiaceae bacterium]
MITSARIAALNQPEDGTPRPDPYGWITALRAPAIKKLMAGDGPLQLSLFDQQDLAEITSGDFPGERLIACRNPVLAAGRARKRRDLLAATEKLLAPVIARVRSGKLTGAGPIGVEVGKVISKYKTRKHFHVTITDASLDVARRQDQIDAEAALDGFYVLRTPIPASELDGPAVVAAYKNLKYAGRDFRHIKSDDLDLRPVFCRLEERVRAHVLICMLACYLTWHLRRAWAPLTFTDDNPPAPASQVTTPSASSPAACTISGERRRPAPSPGWCPARRNPVHLVEAPPVTDAALAQQRDEHRQVVAHMRGGLLAGEAVQVLDDRPVRHAHAEREAAAAERLHGRGLLRQRQRVPRVGRHDPHAEADPAGPGACHGQHAERVHAAREMDGPGGPEPLGLGRHHVTHDVLRAHRRAEHLAPCPHRDPHPRSIPPRGPPGPTSRQGKPPPPGGLRMTSLGRHASGPAQ